MVMPNFTTALLFESYRGEGKTAVVFPRVGFAFLERDGKLSGGGETTTAPYFAYYLLPHSVDS